MVEQVFPNSNPTTTTAQPNAKPSIYLDLSYLRTKAGILKCAEIVCSLLGFICVVSSLYKTLSQGNWFATVSMTAVWFSGIMLVLYIFHVTDKLNMIPWLKIEFCFCLLLTFCYLIAASLAAGAVFDEAFTAAAFFGFFSMILYGCDAFLKFVELKSQRGNVATVSASSST